MVPAVRSTSSARWSENARRGLPGSTMTISPRKIAWLRYDINTNSLLLAERLVPNFPRAARGTSPKLQCSAVRMNSAVRVNRWTKSANSSDSIDPPHSTLSFPFCSHGAVVGVQT